MDFKQKVYNRLPISLQNRLVSIEGRKKYNLRFNNKYSKQVKNELLCSTDHQKMLQIKYLKKYLQKAQNHSVYWKDKLNNINLDCFDPRELKTLPVVSKEDILQNKELFINTTLDKNNLIKVKTGGTSGSGLTFPSTKKSIAVAFTLFYEQCYHKNNFGDKYATFNGNPVVPDSQSQPPFWRYNRVSNQTIFSIAHMEDRNLKYYYQELKNDYLYLNGYPSAIFAMAEFIDSNQLEPIKLNAIYTSSEMLLEGPRAVIERAFDCKVYDLYSNAEQSVLAYQNERGIYDLSLLYSYVWFKETDITVGNETAYKVIGTNFNNDAFFFINYDTNDLVLLNEDGKIKKVLGRGVEVIKLRNGKKLGGAGLSLIFKNAEDIKETQIIQNDYDHIIIKIVLRGNVFKSEKAILNGIRQRFSNEINVDFEIVDRIEKNKNGKFTFIKSRI